MSYQIRKAKYNLNNLSDTPVSQQRNKQGYVQNAKFNTSTILNLIVSLTVEVRPLMQ